MYIVYALINLAVYLIAFSIDKELKNLTNASDGNLSVQLKKLEGWEYIKSEKKLINGKGVTQYQITETGIKQFEEYVVFLESVIADKDNGIQ